MGYVCVHMCFVCKSKHQLTRTPSSLTASFRAAREHEPLAYLRLFTFLFLQREESLCENRGLNLEQQSNF